MDPYGDREYVVQPHGFIRDNHMPDNDIHSQEFFFYMYVMSTEDSHQFMESADGNTYIGKNNHNPAARKIINRLRIQEDSNDTFNAWTKTYAKFAQHFAINEGDEPREFLDLDKMFELMMDIYKKIREKMLKGLNDHFI